MCGLIYAHDIRGNNVNKEIKKIYFQQRERGVKGYGFLSIQDKVVHCRAVYEHSILEMLKQNKSNHILMHHRQPTSTHNVDIAAHPICTNDNFENHKYYLAHNGVILNSRTLFLEHQRLGIRYSSITGENQYHEPVFNDSESLLMELALVLEGKKTKESFNAIGAMAFILVQTDKDGTPLNIYFGRNYKRPLRIRGDNNRLLIASDITGDDVTENVLHKISLGDNTLTREDMVFKSEWMYNPPAKQTVAPITATMGDNLDGFMSTDFNMTEWDDASIEALSVKDLMETEGELKVDLADLDMKLAKAPYDKILIAQRTDCSDALDKIRQAISKRSN